MADQTPDANPPTGPAKPPLTPPRRRFPGWKLPDKHRLPDDYELHSDGLYLSMPRTDRQGNPVEPKLVRVAFGPLAVTGKYVSADDEQWFDLAWHDGRRTVTRRISGSTIRSGAKIVGELGAAGIPLIDSIATKAEQFLAAYRATNAETLDDNAVYLARHLGWQPDGSFVSSNGAPAPVEPAHTEQKPILAAYHPAGTLAEWKKAIAPVEHYPVVRIALAAGFAPVLFRLLGLRSCTLDISGRSTRGKSTAAKIALSPWACPSEEQQAWGTWKSGMIGIEKRFNLMRGLPVVLDETRVVKYPEIVDQVLYQLSMDTGTARGGNYTSANLLEWNTLLISTGEQPALSFTSHEGAAARVLSLRRAPFGLAGEKSATDAKTTEQAVLEQYGTAGPAFVTKLTEMLEETDGAERLRKRHQVLADQHSAAAGTDVARRRAKHAAAVHLAAELAFEWEIVPFPALELAQWTELLGEEVGREDRGAMALDVVRGLIASQGHRIEPAGTGRIGTAAGAVHLAPPGGWIGARVEHRGVPAIALLAGELEQALSAAKPPIALSAVREAWAEAGTIATDPKSKARLDRAAVGGVRLRAFIFALSVLDPDEDGDDNGGGKTGDDGKAAADPTGNEASPPLDRVPEQPPLNQGWPDGSFGAAANS